MDFLHITQLYLIPIILLLFVLKIIFESGPAGKLPPGPSGIPILGNLLHLGPSPHHKLSEWSETYGPLMTLRLGSVTTIVASSPEATRDLLHANDQAFTDRPVPDSVAAQPHPEFTLAWVPGDSSWRARRRLCSSQMFTDRSLDSLAHLRHNIVAHVVEYVRNQARSGAAVDIGAMAFAAALNFLSNTVFSVDVIDTKSFDTAQEFQELVWRIMENAGKPNVSDFFPWLRRFDLQGVRRRVRVSYLRLHEIFDEIIGKRLKERETRRGDFLEVLLDQFDDAGGDDGESGFNSVDTIKPLILDLFIAGSDTSGSTTEWAMAELLKKPETLRKAQQELRTVMGTKDQIKESDINQLPYIQAIIKETLRLHPAAPLLLPYVAGSDIVVDGYNIKKGNQLMINAWSMGRNTKYWTDAGEFSPERFLVESNLDYKGRDFKYIPFGAGRRICPGLPLAGRMVALMLASLLYHFDWELPKGTTPENLDMTEKFGITLKKATPLQAIPSTN